MYEKIPISKDDVLEIMNVIQSYVLQKATYTSEHKHMDMTKLLLHVYGMIEKEHYVDSAFTGKDYYQRNVTTDCPTDEEFFDSICVAEVYNMRSCKYLLLKPWRILVSQG